MRSPRARRLSTITLISIATFVGVAVSSHVQLADSDQAPTPRATVAIAGDAAVSPVPRSYLALSTEYWALPLYAHHLRLFERLLAMFHVRGEGPLILRVGGDSADRVFWDPRSRALPRWAFPLTPGWTRLVAKLVRRVGLRLIVDLNLITGSPASAAAWAKAAEVRLPRRSIIGFEIGNEPDIYSRPAWRGVTAHGSIEHGILPPVLTPGDYVADFRRYAQALRSVAPGTPLLGPALANPRAHLYWTTRLIASHPSGLDAITAHRYVYSGCVHRRSLRFPTIARLLNPRATVRLAASVSGEVKAAKRAGLRFRLTELNSVNCGGRPGVSNAFATALWAPAALFELLRAGVDGVNIHLRADTINAPFALAARGLVARPLLYGLLMFARTLGPHPDLTPLRVSGARSLKLAAWAVRSGGAHLHVLLIDAGRRPIRARLVLPSRGPATIERLLAPSLRSTSGVTLDGQWLGPSGRWQGTPAPGTARLTRRGYLVPMARFSAALVTARLVAGALVRRHPR